MKPSLYKVNRALAREWHPTKNVLLTPMDVTAGSEKKVWWICKQGHAWKAVIAQRNNGTGCPYCSGRRATDEMSLRARNPKLAKEWHPTKNTPLTPKEVTLYSHKKVWWRCKRGHEWIAAVANRSKGRGCSFCQGRRVTDENCLLAISPKLAKEWHPTKNVSLTPSAVLPHSNKKVWWLCRKGHEWKTSINNRSNRVGGCPYCSGRKVNNDNCLKTVSPKLAREWHPTRNVPLTPRDVTSGSERKVWWICKQGHEWKAVIASRSRGCGCPYCSGRFPTKDTALQLANPKLAREWHPTKNAPLTPRDVTARSGKKVWWMCTIGHEWESTVYNRSKGNGCPYCGGKKAADDTCLRTVNPRLAREWHPTKNAPLTPQEVTAGSTKKVWWICRKGHEWEAAIANRNNGRGCPYCASKKVCNDNCLQTVKPAISAEWHPSKNQPLTPKDVTAGSGKTVWWRCRKGHEWAAVVIERNKKGRSCPYCSGRRVCKDNCLQTGSPRLAREWHPVKNAPLTAKDVSTSSSKKVWWACQKGHEWQATIHDRKNKGYGCPFCSGRRPSRENCLKTRGAWLAREWHPTKNREWTQSDVAPYSIRQMWWKCKNGHEQRERVIDRYKRGGCPVCTLKAKVPRLFQAG